MQITFEADIMTEILLLFLSNQATKHPSRFLLILSVEHILYGDYLCKIKALNLGFSITLSANINRVIFQTQQAGQSISYLNQYL